MNNIDNDSIGEETPLLQWQKTVQQLRFMKKNTDEIISSVIKYFRDIEPSDILDYVNNTPMPSGFITAKTSSVRSEDLIDCIHTLLIELSALNDGRGLLLGCYLYLIKECNQSKLKEFKKIGKTHLDLFKQLDL